MMKVTSIFGGLQVFQIILGILRSKLIAVLLGPAGMGISGLLQATTGLVNSATTFGLGTSAVRDISEAHSTGDRQRLLIVSSVFKKLVWFTGFLGLLITLILAPYLSKLAFGDESYTWEFRILSVTLLLGQLSTGQNALLRGMRKIEFTAKAGLYGSILALISSVPFYYFMGIRGIVPALVISSIITLSLSWIFVRKANVPGVSVSFETVKKEGRIMVMLGFFLSLNSLLTLGVSYLIRIFISSKGSLEDVGMYNAGFAILNTYVGMVFTAMSVDYYPRLAATAHDDVISSRIINQQSEIALLILGPILAFFVVFIKWVVVLLYSSEFLLLTDMIVVASIGMLFKSASWAIAFIFLAKGSTKLFFWNEAITNIYMLVLHILGYYYWGLAGLGWAFTITYVLYFAQVWWVSARFYGFRLSKDVKKIITVLFLIIISVFVLVIYGNVWISYAGGSLLSLLAAVYSLRGLNQRMDLKGLLYSKLPGRKS